MSHSQRLYLIGMRLDFAGILILMWGATVPLIFYSFPGHPLLRAAYWAGTSVLAALCTAVSLFPRFNGPALGHARAVLFASFGGGSFLLPVAHGMLLYGAREQVRRVALEWIATTAGFNGLAVGVYVLKVSWGPRLRMEEELMAENSSPNAGFRDGTTYSEQAISLCIFSCSSRPLHMPLQWWRRLISGIRWRRLLESLGRWPVSGLRRMGIK